MVFRLPHPQTINIEFCYRISYTIEMYITFILCLELCKRLFYPHRDQRIDVFFADTDFCIIFFINMYVQSLQHTACGSYTYFCKLQPGLLFQCGFHFTDCSGDSVNIVNLTVEHSSCTVFTNLLCHYFEMFSLLIANCSYNASGSDI